MSITAINHTETGLERLSYRLKRDNVEILVGLLLTKQDELESALTDLAEIKDLDTVTGIWLDYIGTLVGEERSFQQEDEPYRAAIKIRIGINHSGGTPNSMINLIKDYTSSPSVKIIESAYGFGTVSITKGSYLDKDFYALLEEITPVATKWLIHFDFYDIAFIPAYEQNTYNPEVFTTTEDDGVTYETFKTTSDNGASYDIFYTIAEGVTYYDKLVNDGRNTFYYEETLGVVPDNGITLNWEVTDESLVITGADYLQAAASFSADYLDVTFDGSGSDDYYNDITEWLWDFDDGETATGEQVTHTYEDSGSYNVTLTVTNVVGGTSTATLQVVVIAKAESNFTYEIRGLQVVYDSSTSKGELIDTEWNFGDGVLDSAKKPSHTYPEEGTYTVSLKVTDEDLNISTSYKTVTIENTGIKIGDVILTDDIVIYDTFGDPTYSLLELDGSTYDQTLYPELYLLLGTNVLKEITTTTSSPYPYKIVADYQGI